MANFHAARATEAGTLDGKDSTDFAPKSAEAWRELENWPSRGPGGTLSTYGCCGPCPPGSTTRQATRRPTTNKDPYGVVHLKGRVRWNMKSAGSDNRWWSYRMMNLPQGYRPSGDRTFAVVSNNQLSATLGAATGTTLPGARTGAT